MLDSGRSTSRLDGFRSEIQPYTHRTHHIWLVNFKMYHNVPKFLDRQVWANSVDSDQTEEQSAQDLHCWPFWLHYRYSTVKPPCLNFRVITAKFSDVQIFRIFTVQV